MTDRETLVALDRKYVWRPYTSSEDHEGQDPIVVVGAEGAHLIDADGRRYLDGSGSWWCNSLGHGHPRIKQAIARQLETFAHCSLAGITHEPAARLAEELIATAPEGLERVFYSDNGSTAVEVAVKMAFQYWQQNGRPSRTRFIALPGAYHGDTIGAMSFSAVDEFSAIFAPLLADTWRPPVDPAEEGFEAVFEAIFAELRARPDDYAGVIVEPLVQGCAGMRMYDAKLLSALREVTREVDTFLVVDEVITGFGRTGPMWASEHAGITPDLIATSKGLTAGTMPFSATLATGRIFDGFRGDKTRALMHGHTFCGNPLGASVAREVLAIYRDEAVLETARARAAQLAAGVAEIAKLDGVRNTRTLGMIAALDLGALGYYGKLGWVVTAEALKRGAQLRPLGNTVYMIPSLTIAEADLAALLDIARESIAAAMRMKG